MRYTYGQSETAAQRLKQIARVFDPHSSAFIESQMDLPVKAAIDLGCGPGFTTRMLAHASRAASTCGLDASCEFLLEAKRRFSDYEFIQHDLTRTPFPVNGGVMYCRFLLSHLRQPVSLMNRWSRLLPTGGLLLAEELEDIDTGIEVFQRYLTINRGLVASQGARLYVGAELARGKFDARVRLNQPFILPVTNSDAATMFFSNTTSIWEKEEFVLGKVPAAERREISQALKAMIEDGDRRTGIIWKMRRILIQA